MVHPEQKGEVERRDSLPCVLHEIEQPDENDGEQDARTTPVMTCLRTIFGADWVAFAWSIVCWAWWTTLLMPAFIPVLGDFAAERGCLRRC